ncbi:MAG: hypothetical protein FJ291_05715 [Planctomycetes bacterium]|nr:hypothetical protein [Planctomycetota bacterium]
MVSYDACPEVRALYAGRRWWIIGLQWKYCGRYAMSNQQKAARQKERKVTGTELLIVSRR